MAGNGGRNGEIARWVIGLVLAALVAYFTTIGTLATKIATLERDLVSQQRIRESQFDEIQRSLADIKIELREMRRGVR